MVWLSQWTLAPEMYRTQQIPEIPVLAFRLMGLGCWGWFASGASDSMHWLAPLDYVPQIGDLKLTKLGLLSRHSVAKLTQLLLQVSCGFLACLQVRGPAIHTGAQLFGGGPASIHPSPHAVPHWRWWVSSWILEAGVSKSDVPWSLSLSFTIQRQIEAVAVWLTKAMFIAD